MSNLDIKEFKKYNDLADTDCILASKTDLDGSDASLPVGRFKEIVGLHVAPKIKNGYWWINGINTNIIATGQTPVFRHTDWGLEYKYENQDDAAYVKLISIEDLSGGSLEAADRAEKAAINANEQAGYAKTQGDEAKVQGTEAKKQGSEAKIQSESAKIQAEIARIQAEEAKKQAAEAKKQGDYAKAQGDKITSYDTRITSLEKGKADNAFTDKGFARLTAGGVPIGDPFAVGVGGGGPGGGMQYLLKIVNNLESRNIYASKGQPCYINFTFVSQQREDASIPYYDTGERGYCQIFVRSGGDAYKEVRNFYLNSNKETAIDIVQYLASGENEVKVSVIGEDTGVTASPLTYTAQLTTLSLSANNFQWWNAFMSNIIIPMNIGGNINKTLHVEILGENYLKVYDVNIGTAIYTETAYNYSLTHPGKTGVFNVSFYVQNIDGAIKTNILSFNIIAIMEGSSNKLIAINNVSPKAVNWTENKLFEFSMYDGGKSLTSATFKVYKENASFYSSVNDRISTSSKNIFSIPLEIETLDNANFEIIAKVFYETFEIKSVKFLVDNSLGFSAESGSVLYVNPKTRNNNQNNYQQIINEVDGSSIAATWNNLNWGNDGWVRDKSGSNVLRLFAGTSVDISYKPFQEEYARIGKTIEIDFSANNVTDYSKEIATIASGTAAFVGIKLYPDNIIMHSQSLKNDAFQSININDSSRIRMSMTIMPDAYGNPGFNLCIIYLNGKKNREFNYQNNDYFQNDGNIIMGSPYSDIDIYGIRIYNVALTSQSILKNYTNWLVTNEEKISVREENNILDSSGTDVAYESVKNKYNTFVFDNTFPRLSNPNRYTGTLTVEFPKMPEHNVTITNAECRGQGTSSMRYWWWNLQWRLNATKSIVTKADGSTSTGFWQMLPSIPKAARYTAKKNFASSMQSHKMGSVVSINELYKEMGMTNEAMLSLGMENSRISVYQEPFVGFEKTKNEEGEDVYVFMGIYTLGPDKGDTTTFGYDKKKFTGLISIEGSDNAPLCTLFRVPWNERVIYNEDEEEWQYNGVNSWSFGAGSIDNISKWIPAYNLTYECAPRLKPFNGTLAELNAAVDIYRNEPNEFWISKTSDSNLYNVYYFEESLNKFIASSVSGNNTNLVTQLAGKGYGLNASDLTGKTDAEKNKLFIDARINKFKKEAGAYWDIEDAVFNRNWVEFNAGTDQRAKNTYPYNFGETGSKWKWRYDDMDTIFDTDNQGQPRKPYYVEVGDKYDNGAPVWNGETSNFWNLIEVAFPDEIITGMRNMLSTMEELGGLNQGDDFDKLYAYFDKYYFSKAQKYFPINLYNADAKFTYETAKLAYISGIYTNDTDPITQSLGDHYSAEQAWIMKRIVYIMSKYSFGMFSAAGTDNITVRAAGNTIRYELTPAIDLYPGIASGTSIIRGIRTKAGEVCPMVINLSGSGDQQNTIQGASYLQDIGQWHNKNVTGSMIVQGKRLREVKIGHKTEPIVISVTSLTISNCVSLQKLVLSRVSTLLGSINLSECTHLKEMYADGTKLSQIILSKGGGLELIEFGSYNQYINLQNFPLLRDAGIIIDTCKDKITDFLVTECPNVNSMLMLLNIYNAQIGQQSHALKRIRCIGFDVNVADADIVKFMAFADGSYNGLDSNGISTSGKPVLEGTIRVNIIAQNQLDTLRVAFPELTIVYVTLKPSPVTTFVFSSSQSKPIANGVFTANYPFTKINEYTYKVTSSENVTLDITFKANNHQDFATQYLVIGDRTQNYSVTYIPLRTIRVKVYNQNIYPSGAIVIANGKSYTTDSNGYVYIRSGEAVSGTVSAYPYVENTFNYEAIVNDTSHSVDIYPAVDVKFIVKSNIGILLENADVTVNNITKKTNIYGEAIFQLGKGTYPYTVTHPDFVSYNNSTTVNINAITVNVALEPKFVQVNITISSELNIKIKGAIVKCGDKTATSNVNGIASIMMPSRASNTYTVEAKDYEFFEGRVNTVIDTVNTSITLNIDILSLKPEENGNIQLLLQGVRAIVSVTNYSSYDYIIDWGDGNTTEGISTGSVPYEHVYSSYNLYQVEIINCDNIVNCIGDNGSTIAYWSIGNSKVRDITFNNYNKLKYFGNIFKNDINRFSFDSLFNQCWALKAIDLTPLNICIKATNANNMFGSCRGLTAIDLTPLNTWINTITANNMFSGCNNLTELDLTPLSSWINITKSINIFADCRKLVTIDLTPLSSWVNITNISGIFFQCTGLTELDLTPLSSLVNLTDVNSIFSNCTSLTKLDLTPLSSWINVIFVNNIFSRCGRLTAIDLTPLSSWTNVITAAYMFDNCSGLTELDLTPLSSWTNVESNIYMFNYCSGLTELDLTPLSSWINTTLSAYMFAYCRKLVTIDLTPLSGWVNITNANYMFYNCNDLTELDLTPLGNWVKMINNLYMTSTCYSLIFIKSLSNIPFYLSTTALENGNSCPIYVPNDKVDVYKTATNWNAYASRIKPISEKP